MIKLDSRYFVTAANVGKIVYLREAVIDFIEFVRKSTGNLLEQSVFQKQVNWNISEQMLSCFITCTAT